MLASFLRQPASSLLLVALFTSSASGNWISDWFTMASHEELPAPAPEFSGEAVPMPEPLPMAGEVPTLTPPYQSHRWADDEPLLPMGEASSVVEDWPEGVPAELPEGFSGSFSGSFSGGFSGGFSGEFSEDLAVPTEEGITSFDPAYPADLDAAPGCCKSPKIRYWNHPLIGWVTPHDECVAMQHAILELAGECCPIQVPVTIPASCVGAPELETREGLLGRTTHTYCWPCGYRVKIVRWCGGDLIVHTYNPPTALPLQCLLPSSGGRLIEL